MRVQRASRLPESTSTRVSQLHRKRRPRSRMPRQSSMTRFLLVVKVSSLIWIIFTGAALGIRENTHLGMDSVVKMLPRKCKVAFAVISHVLMLGTAGFLLAGSWQQMEVNKDTTALGAVAYPLAWVYAAGVYGSLAIGFLVALNLKRILTVPLSDDELVMVRDAEGLQEAEELAAHATPIMRADPAARSQK